MEEVFSECDVITVMRDGHTISTKPVQETTVDEVVHHMVGRSIDEFYPDRTTAPGDVVLTVNGLKPKDFNSTIPLIYVKAKYWRSRPHGGRTHRNHARHLRHRQTRWRRNYTKW